MLNALLSAVSEEMRKDKGNTDSDSSEQIPNQKILSSLFGRRRTDDDDDSDDDEYYF